MNYEVTIGIPVYNIEKFIRRCMDAVLAQTFESIEFLILDDCGTDSSIDIVREYQRVHPRGKDIRVVSQPYNKGIGEARNRIVDEARGRYIYFMDGDDVIASNTIELLYENACRYKAQLVYGSYERVEEFSGKPKRVTCRYPVMQFLDEDAFATYVYRQYEGIQAMVWNILIDINVYRDNNLRHLPISYWEDFVFTMDLPTYVKRAVLLPDITYSYICRYGSLSNFQKREYIEKREIESTIGAMRFLKRNSSRLKRKSYFSMRMCKVMATCFYIVCNILHNKDIVTPPFNKREIREVMLSPLSLNEILHFRQGLAPNLLFFLFGLLPPTASVWLMKLVAKRKGLI